MSPESVAAPSHEKVDHMPWARDASSTGPAPGGVLVSNRLKLKLMIDQDDGTEIHPGDDTVTGRKIEEWKLKVNEGVPPDPEIAATNDQITVLQFKLNSGRNPFADFGVWRNRGDRLLGVLYFVMQKTA